MWSKPERTQWQLHADAKSITKNGIRTKTTIKMRLRCLKKYLEYVEATILFVTRGRNLSNGRANLIFKKSQVLFYFVIWICCRILFLRHYDVHTIWNYYIYLLFCTLLWGILNCTITSVEIASDSVKLSNSKL